MSELDSSKKRYLSLRIKIWLVFILIFTPVFVASYIWFYLYTSERVSYSINEDLIQTVEGAIKGMDLDGFTALYDEERANNPLCSPEVDPEDSGYYPENPLYWEHVTWLGKVGDLDPQARLYTYVKGDEPGEVISIGSSGALWNPPGGWPFCWQYTSTGTRIYEGLTTRVDVREPYTDDFGTWITTYMPMEQDGQIVGAIGVDIEYSYVKEVQDGIINNGLVAFIVSYVLIFGLVYYMAGVVTKPIVNLADVALQIGEGNYDQDLDSLTSNQRWVDEIYTLVNTFKIMIGKVAEREQNLRARVQQLEIMIDEGKREQQVQEIVDSDFFRDLQLKAQKVRERDEEAKKKKGKG